MTRSSRERASSTRPTGWRSWAGTGRRGFSRCSPSARWRRRSWTRWSGTLDELTLRYLAQQAELGGAEVILSGKRAVAAPIPAQHPEERRAERREPSAAPAADASTLPAQA